MDPHRFLAWFLAYFAASVAVHLGLDALNLRELRRHRRPPARLVGRIPAETFARSQAYTLDRLRFDGFSVVYSAAINLILLFSGILPSWDGWLGAWLPGLHREVAFLATLVLLQGALNLPLAIQETFRIEGRHGFNTMTFRLYLSDLVKEFLFALVLGIPFLYLFFAFLEHAGPGWWLWAFALVALFQIALLVVYPWLIAPLFNRFRPLEDGALRARLLSLAAALRFPARDIYVMDGSRRSRHSNAYFTGFGRWRRIVLFDTLLAQMDADEIAGVLAHEVGHYRRGHIYQSLAIQLAWTGLGLFLLSRAIAAPALYHAFGFPAPEHAAGIFLALTVFSTLAFPLAPVRNFLSRRHEYQADAFAVLATCAPGPMESALVKLSAENLANLTPHPWYSAFHYSHPALLERLRGIEGQAARFGLA